MRPDLVIYCHGRSHVDVIREALALGRARSISNAEANNPDGPGLYAEVDAAKRPFDRALGALDDVFLVQRGLLHIATCLSSLLDGVEDEETLEECQQAAEVWMDEVRRIARGERFSTVMEDSLRKDARV